MLLVQKKNYSLNKEKKINLNYEVLKKLNINKEKKLEVLTNEIFFFIFMSNFQQIEVESIYFFN